MFIWFRWLKMNYPMIIRQSCHYDFFNTRVIDSRSNSLWIGGGKSKWDSFPLWACNSFLSFRPRSHLRSSRDFLEFHDIFLVSLSRSVFAFAASRLGSFGDTLPSWLRNPKLWTRSISYFGREKCASGKTALRNICQRKKVSLEQKKVETMTGGKRAEKVFYQT